MLLYGLGPSRSLRASWALEEAGVEWKYVRLNAREGEHRKDSYLAINPGGKVPALVDGDVIVTESLAVVTYIGEKYPSSQLVPSSLAERAQYFRWCAFAISELEQPLWLMGKHSFALPTEYRVTGLEKTATFEFDKAVQVLATGLADREFILGSTFTGADILLGHTLSWARFQKFAIEPANVQEYADRVLARPAFARARDIEKNAPFASASA